MNTKKQTLIESINRQRKLMGLNEIMDVNTNIDAKGALSGNKLDLGMVPLEEMDPDDDDDLPASYRMYNSDEWVKAQKDELGGDDDDDESKMDSDYYDDRSDDERDFYRGEEPMSLDDRMDMEYPDPNEREWQANRYGRQDEVMDELGTPPGVSDKKLPPVIRPDQMNKPKLPPGVSDKKLPPVIRPDQMMNESELDEGFGDFIGGLKNVGQMAGKAVGGAAQKAGQAIGGAAQKAGQAVGSAYKEGNIKSKVATTQKQIDSVFAGLQNFAKINDQNLAQLNDVKLKLLSNKPTNPADITKQKQLVDKVGVLIKKTAQANNLLRMGVSSFGKKMAENENMDEGFGDFIGGLKNVGQMAGKAVGGAAQKAGQAIGGAAQKAGQAVGGAAQKAGQAIGSAYNVGALSNQVSNVEKTMNKTMGDIKNYLDKNAKVYNDIANLQTQITSLSPQLQKELGAQLKKLGNTATSLTNLKKVVNPTMRTTGAGVAGSTNMAQSGRTTP
jgi:hypothetical protein